MIERWCAWHKPAPIMFAHYGDGRKKVSRTHGICPKCLPRVLAELNERARKGYWYGLERGEA
jgi:ribosomal protein S27AE